MKRSLSAVIAAGFAASTVAVVAFPLTAQPEGAPPEIPTQPPVIPDQPAALPVPDGPALHTETLEGGLIVEDLKIGEGYEAQAGQWIVAHYHGTLKSDGTMFDSSYERGEPVAFSLESVIEGWQKGVPGMKFGGIRRLTIPAALAWGETGRAPTIGPNADVVFIIELVNALQTEDVVVGEGEEATLQCLAVTRHKFMDAEGTTIEEVTGVPYVWLPGELQGVTIGVMGMKVGGTRRITIPKELNVCGLRPDMCPRDQNVPITVEVELVAVRNLPAR
jgi:FKBP-type peptidyl-prolyl cis-trans isomerase